MPLQIKIKGMNIVFPLQTMLIIGKLLALPYLATASWWVIFLPILIPLGIIGSLLIFAGICFSLGCLLEHFTD